MHIGYVETDKNVYWAMGDNVIAELYGYIHMALAVGDKVISTDRGYITNYGDQE